MRKILGVPVVLWLFPPVALTVLIGNLVNQNKITEDENKRTSDEKENENEKEKE